MSDCIQVHSFLITNLAIGDFCMGVYLLIIAAVDAYYRGHYIVYDAQWRGSGLCHFAGFISTFSSELSVFSLTIITLHRLLSILFPFRIKDMEYSGAVRVMVVAWLIVSLRARCNVQTHSKQCLPVATGYKYTVAYVKYTLKQPSKKGGR